MSYLCQIIFARFYSPQLTKWIILYQYTGVPPEMGLNYSFCVLRLSLYLNLNFVYFERTIVSVCTE